jgi:serine/threonine protein kinase
VSTPTPLSSSAPPRPPGKFPKSLFGYPVVERLGEGAHSTIYVVNDRKTGQVYALKHVVPTEPKHVRFVEQLQTEFRVSRTFRHPGLRKCLKLTIRKRWFGFGKVKEAMLLMELVDGVPLDRDLPDGVPAVVDVFLKVCEALGAVHHYGWLHCDTKPNNIMRDPAGHVKVIDFGQACPNGTVKTRVQGTPDFIAPEQARVKQLGFFTDVYNVGATLYWALTDGRRVPTMLTVAKADRDIVREQKFPAPAEMNPAVPAGLSELVMECVRVHPAARPQTMGEVIRRLGPYGTGSGVGGRRSGVG